jgi:hypothetical protein
MSLDTRDRVENYRAATATGRLCRRSETGILSERDARWPKVTSIAVGPGLADLDRPLNASATSEKVASAAKPSESTVSLKTNRSRLMPVPS